MGSCKLRPGCQCEERHRKYCEGDLEAQNDLILYLGPMVERAIKRILPFKREHEAREDVKQITFFKMNRAIKTWRGDCDFCAWVFRIATSAARDELRKQMKQERVLFDSDPIDELADSSQPPSLEFEDCVKRALERLPANWKLAYELHLGSGKTIEEIAMVVKRKTRMVRYWLKDIRELLEACLD
jgi:RNA polymerase sigma factor (sigma-70 family)